MRTTDRKAYVRKEQVEARLGRPMAEILKELFGRYSDTAKVAAFLDVDLTTVYRWVSDEGLVLRTVTQLDTRESKAEII